MGGADEFSVDGRGESGGDGDIYAAGRRGNYRDIDNCAQCGRESNDRDGARDRGKTAENCGVTECSFSGYGNDWFVKNGDMYGDEYGRWDVGGKYCDVESVTVHHLTDEL